MTTEIFIKKLTPIDIGKGLEFPSCAKLEALPRFSGSQGIELSVIIEAAGTQPLPTTFHCTTAKNGRLAFTGAGLFSLARNDVIKVGDTVTFYMEGGKYKLRVRNHVC